MHLAVLIRAVAIVTGMLAVATAQAGTGFRLMLPGWPQKPGAALVPAGKPLSAPTTPATGNRTGLVLTLDSTWVEGNGYRPLRITVAPTTPTQADRSLTVSFRPGNYRNPTAAVTREIELPAGFTSVTATLSVPQLGPWHSIAFDVFEDGEHLRELSIPQYYLGMGGSQYTGDSASPAILTLNATAASHLILNAMGRSGQPVLQVGPSNTLSTASYTFPGNPMRNVTVDMAAAIPTMADLPDRWIDYSTLDFIIASRQDLQTLIDKHQPQWRAIRRWIGTGGNLIVYGVGTVKNQQSWQNWDLAADKPWEHLDEINRWIRFPEAAEQSQFAESVPALRGWAPPNSNAVFSTIPLQESGASADGKTTEVVFSQSAWSDSGGKFPFAMRRLGQGQVVAIPDSDPTNNGQFPWQMMFASLGAEHWAWPTRHGVNFSQENTNYWNFLIPGVGAAPVTAFQVLITLFVLAIGPLNFYVLRRWHKLNLLLITVPVCAGVVTLALLLYAIFADGFGVKARTRSFTEIDQRTGEAVCLGRMTYYAGLTPSSGLTFPGDTAVYPLSETAIGNQSETTRRVAWHFDEDDIPAGRQLLESGWLQSRIQTQLVTVGARKTKASIKISAEGDRATVVKNELGVPISWLVVCDSGNNYRVARDLADGEQASLVEPEDLAGEIDRLEGQHYLRPPEGVRLGGSDSIFGIRRRYYSRYYPGMSGSMVDTTGVSMLERSLTEALEKVATRQMPRRSYVAIVPHSPEFELGLESASSEGSFHVINGRW